MTDKFKFWSTLIIGFIAALSWTPFLIERLSRKKLDGKIISQYSNFTKDKKEILLLYKISVVSRNKDFFLKDIDLKIKFNSSDFLNSTARNNRLTVFTWDKPKRLIVPDKEFLNNISVLSKNEPVVGYLSFLIPYDKDEPVEEVQFLFKSYNNKVKSLVFKTADIKQEKLLFDDTIWEDFDFNDERFKELVK